MPRKQADFFVLAFDVGTSSLRSALFDSQARRIDGTMQQIEYQVSYGEDGRAKHKPKKATNARRSLKRPLAREEGQIRSFVSLANQF